MKLPPADHPFWKLAQSVVSVIGLAILAVHHADGGHHGGIDAADASGAIGGGLGVRLAWQAVKSWRGTA